MAVFRFDKKVVTSAPSSLSAAKQWLVTCASTVLSTYALDAMATAAGLALVASGLLNGLSHQSLLSFLVLTYIAWGIGLRTNLQANWALLTATGTSTNVLSKLAYEIFRRRSQSPRVQRFAAHAGYVVTELAKEVPYYVGAVGVTILSDTLTARDAIIFLGGANLGAAIYEYGLARLCRAFLKGTHRD